MLNPSSSPRFRLAASALVGAVLAASACAMPAPKVRSFGIDDQLAPRLERMSRRSATVSVQRPAHIAIIQVGTGGSRAVYPLEGHAPRELAPGRHRIRLATGPGPGRTRPGGVRIARVCADDRSPDNGSQRCSWRQVGTAAGGGAPPGFRYYVVLAIEAPVSAAVLQASMPSVSSMEDPEEVTRVLARALASGRSDAGWAAYVSNAF